MNVDLYLELLEEKHFKQLDRIDFLEQRIRELEGQRQGATMAPTVMRGSGQINVNMDNFHGATKEHVQSFMNAVNTSGQKLSDAMP